MARVLPLVPVLASVLLLAGCASSASHSAASPTPDTGPSIADLSRQAVAAATQAAYDAPTPRSLRARRAAAASAGATAQQPLAALLLQANEVPPGFVQQQGPVALNFGVNGGGVSATLNGQTVQYSVARPGGGKGLLIESIFSATDASGAGADLRGAVDEAARVLARGGDGFTAVPLASRPAVGEEAQGLRLTSTASGAGGGYAVVFRRGSILVDLMLIETPAPAAIDDLIGLAQRQDSKLGSTLQ